MLPSGGAAGHVRARSRETWSRAGGARLGLGFRGSAGLGCGSWVRDPADVRRRDGEGGRPGQGRGRAGRGSASPKLSLSSCPPLQTSRTTAGQERAPESEPVWERPWSVEEIRRSCQSWSLAADAGVRGGPRGPAEGAGGEGAAGGRSACGGRTAAPILPPPSPCFCHLSVTRVTHTPSRPREPPWQCPGIRERAGPWA